jgi:hypothetical protein
VQKFRSKYIGRFCPINFTWENTVRGMDWWTPSPVFQGNFLSLIDPERGEFGVIFPEVMIYSERLCPEETIITEGNIAESPERRFYKCYITPKVKELTMKFRINFKTCWIYWTTRIQFLISYVYLSFWRFVFKIFEHVSFGSLKVTYVLKIFG